MLYSVYNHLTFCGKTVSRLERFPLERALGNPLLGFKSYNVHLKNTFSAIILCIHIKLYQLSKILYTYICTYVRSRRRPTFRG